MDERYQLTKLPIDFAFVNVYQIRRIIKNF